MENVNFVIRKATVEEFIDIRQSVDWNCPKKDETIEIALENTLFQICVEKDDELIGYGRILGDNAFTFYIQDVIVKPKYQGNGIGGEIMNIIMQYLKDNYSNELMVCLLSAKGKEGFYKKFGFIERPDNTYGAGMINFIN